MVQPLRKKSELVLRALRRADYARAEEIARKAVASSPATAENWSVLGVALFALRRPAEALDALGQALVRDPFDLSAVVAVSHIARHAGMAEETLPFLKLVSHQHANKVVATLALVDALLSLDRVEEASVEMALISRLAPDNPDVALLRGRIAHAEWRLDDAEALFRQVIELRPEDAKAHYHLAWTRADAGRWIPALAAADRALTWAPDRATSAATRFLVATILLAMGELQEGWTAYAARLDPDLPGAPVIAVDAPRWDGASSLRGRNLLVMGEQGLGDEIAFLGLLGDLSEAVGPTGRLSLCIDPRLHPLVARQWPDLRLLGHETRRIDGRPHRAPVDAPPAELFTLQGDLLRLFRAAPADFAGVGGYLAPCPERMRTWRGWLDQLPPGPKVGLTWRSGKMVDSRSRNFAPVAEWAPVTGTGGVQFINLQYGWTAEELAELQSVAASPVTTPPDLDLFHDLEGLAALAATLDLTIGFSNATTNLIGALGCPLWLITPPGAWTALGTAHYPWYPQARRFGAQYPDPWSQVMQSVGRDLTGWLGASERRQGL